MDWEECFYQNLLSWLVFREALRRFPRGSWSIQAKLFGLILAHSPISAFYCSHIPN
jgi:hypothetical protein